MGENRAYRQELDAVKGLSIAGVVLIHITGTAATQADGALRVIATFGNQIARFSVPVFILVAGILLTYGRSFDSPLNYLEFVLRRARSLMIPYLIWTAISLAHLSITSKNVVLSVVFGKGFYYQLYFVPLIFQFYVFTPIFRFFTTTRARSLIGCSVSIGTTLLLALSFELIGMGYLQVPTSTMKYLNLLYQVASPAWMGYFVLGCTVGRYYDRICKWVLQLPWRTTSVIMAVSLVGLWSDFTVYVEAAGRQSGLAFGFGRPAVTLYSLGISLALFKWFLSNPSRWAITLGKYSFGIYLIHLAVQEVLLIALPSVNATWYGLLTEFFVVLGVSLGATVQVSRMPLGWLLVGETSVAKLQRATSGASA